MCSGCAMQHLARVMLQQQGIGFREMMCHAWRCSKKRNRCDVMIEEEEGRGGKKSKAKEKK